MNGKVCNRLLKESYKKRREFKIHSRFDHAVNLIDGQGSLMTILDQTKTMMPFSLMLPFLPAISEKQKMDLYDGKILVNGKLFIDFQDFEVYDGSLCDFKETVDWDQLQDCFKILALFLKKQGNEDGMLSLVTDGSLNRMNQIIQEDFLAWLNAYQNDSDFEVWTQRMIGFGVGLTPGFDDLLCGLMLSDLYFYKALGWNVDPIIEKNKKNLPSYQIRTTCISYHMLQMAGNGLGSQAVKELLNAFYKKQDHLEMILMEIKNFGHSSGTDILCGIYLSMKNKIERKNEYVSNDKRNYAESV